MLAARQLPIRALLSKWKSKQLTDGQLFFIAIRGHTDRDGGLGHITPQSSMKFIPPTEDRAPIGIGFAFNNGMMNAVHTRRDNGQVQNALESDWQPPVGMMKTSRGLKRDEEDDKR